MNKEECFDWLKEKFKEIIDSNFLSFEEVASKKSITGVYFIYLKDNENKPIYIGNTNKFNVRFGIDLKDKSTHTLHKKLLNEGLSKEEIIDLLVNNCKFKIEECGNSDSKEAKIQAEALEHFAILVFQPKYNAHIYKKLSKRKEVEE